MRPLLISLFGLALLAPVAAAGDGDAPAAASASETDIPVEALRQRSNQLKGRARALRQEAETIYRQESAECRKAVLVNNCIGDAADRRLEKVEAARALEKERATLDQQIRQRELADKRAERARRAAERGLPISVEVEAAGGNPGNTGSAGLSDTTK